MKDSQLTPTTTASESDTTPTQNRREFIKQAGIAGILAAGVAPYAYSQSNPIKWRLQSYSGAPLGAHVIKPQVEAFNRAAHGQMEIELYYADQLVPTGELFRGFTKRYSGCGAKR